MTKANKLLKSMHPRTEPAFSALSRLTERAQKARVLIFVFYMVSVLEAYGLLTHLHELTRQQATIYQWPVAWLEGVSWPLAPSYIAILIFASGLLCTMYMRLRWPRIVFAASLLMGVALLNSFGSVNHDNHIWLWLSLLLCVAPSDLSATASRKNKLGLLAVFSGMQLFVLLTYSLAGLHKVKGGVIAMANGDAGNFSWTGFASQLADRSLQTGTEPIAADLVIQNPHFFAPMFWLLILLQFVALGVIFLPRYHRLFGLVMIGFHFGTWALMEIPFPLHVIWLMIFFVFSPFRPTNGSDDPIPIARDALACSRAKISAMRVRLARI